MIDPTKKTDEQTLVDEINRDMAALASLLMRAVLQDMIEKLHWNKNHKDNPDVCLALSDEQMAIMVKCTEAVAMMLARQILIQKRTLAEGN